MRTDQNHVAASYYVSDMFPSATGSTELIQAHNNIKSEFARPLTLENSLLKPLACGFARNLRCVNIPVNKKNYVLLLM
jgi:hypothetical protein